VKRKYSFEIFAYVLLPDHFHWIIKMPEDDTDFSKIVHSVKRNFTLNYKKSNGINHQMNVWQPRFWDHVIRDEQDLKNHLDYIHWNPVKHEITNQPDQYRFSSFQSFLKRGVYPEDYAFREMPSHVQAMELE
jgi:putative transposase